MLICAILIIFIPTYSVDTHQISHQAGLCNTDTPLSEDIYGDIIFLSYIINMTYWHIL